MDAYTFAGSAGDIALVRMSGTGAPDVRLYGPDGTLLCWDTAFGSVAEISGCALPSDGTYAILAGSWVTPGGGAYNLWLLPGTEANLALSKACTPDPVRTVHHVECNITVTNIGDGEALDVVLQVTLPSEAKSLVSVSPGPPTCNEAGGVITCNLGTLAADDGAPGGADEAAVVVTFQAPKTGRSGPEDNLDIPHCADVSASNEPPENAGTDNYDCDVTTVLWKCPDVNEDGTVSLGDLARVAFHWREPVSDKLTQFLDLDNNGTISLGDLAQVAFHWREICPL